jgi:hypothetical protein
MFCALVVCAGAHDLQFVIPVCLFQLVISEAGHTRGPPVSLAVLPAASRPLQGLLHRTQLLVLYMAGAAGQARALVQGVLFRPKSFSVVRCASLKKNTRSKIGVTSCNSA